MLGLFRVAWRLALMTILTAGLLFERLLGLPLALVSKRLERRHLSFITKIWGRLVARVIGMRVEITGEPPEPPFILVSNHLGYVDTLLLVAYTGGVFVARADVAHWPLAGIVARGVDTIFIDRSRVRDTARVNELIGKELEREGGVIFYAEGGTGPGDAVRPFKSSLLEPAAALGIPVHYCTIRFETYPGDPPASEAVVWHSPLTFPQHLLRLLQLRGFKASATFGNRPIQGSDRKQLAIQLHDAVQERFAPIP